MSKDRREIKFDKLRERYLARTKKLDEHKLQIHSKYGDGWSDGWLANADRRKLESERDQVGKTGDAFFEYLTSISPRDWSYGVPSFWLYESLSFADAVRPVDEPLSVVPPLSYGSTRPRI
jgi:hypothetical protein